MIMRYQYRCQGYESMCCGLVKTLLRPLKAWTWQPNNGHIDQGTCPIA